MSFSEEHDHEHGKDAAQHEEAGHPFFPHHILDELMIVCAVFGVVLTMAILLPFHLHEKADPMYTPPGIKPEWYFLPMYQSIKYVPKTLGVISTGLVFGLIIAWPFMDALLGRLFPRRRFYRVVGIIGVLGALMFGALGFICERDVTVFGQQYSIDAKGIPHPTTKSENKSEAERSATVSGQKHDTGAKSIPQPITKSENKSDAAQTKP